MQSMKIRTQLTGDVADIKVLMNHPMETGLRKDGVSGKLVPIHFIEHVIVTLNGAIVYEMQWSQAISTNPYLNFVVHGVKAGDELAVDWSDNLGEKGHLASPVGMRADS